MVESGQEEEWEQVEVVYRRGYGLLPEAWEVFFRHFPLVERVEVCEPVFFPQDVTVFYGDSCEPFPLSGLERESPVSLALRSLVDLP